MDELDQLKKQWKEDQHFDKVDQSTIKTMLHKSSTSIVKWIFIICCIEFIIGLIIPFILPSEKETISIFRFLEWFYSFVVFISCIYFIEKFYKLHRKIKSTNNIKSLLLDILKVRKNAEEYIKFNINCFIYVIIISIIRLIIDEYITTHSWNKVIFVTILGSIISLIFGYIIIKLIKVYYKMLYGILLKKLDKNYEELTRLEED